MKAYDHIVVGIGAAGSATLYSLAKRGFNVLGLEAQPALAHPLGSSHGGSRITRLVYQENGSYVSLLRRSFPLWRQLERQTGRQLVTLTGCLNASAAGGAGAHGHSCFDGAVLTAQEHSLPHEILSSQQVAHRFPAYALSPHFQALWDPAGGVLHPERCIQAFVQAAKQHGARVLCGTKVASWEAALGGGGSGETRELSPAAGGSRQGVAAAAPAVVVHTSAGTFRARRLVLTAGAWMPALVPELAPLLSVERQVVGWFRPTQKEVFAKDRFPVFLLDDEQGYYYGFPADGDGLVKLGKYGHLQQVSSAEDVDRAVRDEDEEALRRCLKRYFPALGAAAMERASVCTFTNTADGHFILDAHPRHPDVILGSACSGHGFKFAPVLGEILADLATAGSTQMEAGLHRLRADRAGHAALLV